MSAAPDRRREPQPGAPRRLDVVRLIATLLLFLAAPTAGDIGGCGEAPADLDAVKFFTAKEAIDCAKCSECVILSDACDRACDFSPNQTAFPVACYPLIHDGEVCLNALDAAGCDDYKVFMADGSVSVPTECNFCPSRFDPSKVDAGGGVGGAGTTTSGSGGGGPLGEVDDASSAPEGP